MIKDYNDYELFENQALKMLGDDLYYELIYAHIVYCLHDGDFDSNSTNYVEVQFRKKLFKDPDWKKKTDELKNYIKDRFGLQCREYNKNMYISNIMPLQPDLRKYKFRIYKKNED